MSFFLNGQKLEAIQWSINNRMDKLRYSHTVEPYVTMKMKNLLLYCNNMNEFHRLNFELAKHKTVCMYVCMYGSIYVKFINR